MILRVATITKKYLVVVRVTKANTTAFIFTTAQRTDSQYTVNLKQNDENDKKWIRRYLLEFWVVIFIPVRIINSKLLQPPNNN
jgi:hypothetical protein